MTRPGLSAVVIAVVISLVNATCATASLATATVAAVTSSGPVAHPPESATTAGVAAARHVEPDSATILPSRALYGWGSNDWGQVGTGASGEGTPTDVALPVPASLPPGVSLTAVAAGGAFTVGLTSGGQVYTWGADFSGQLGVGSTIESDVAEPVAIPGGSVVAIAAGSSHALALTDTGQIYAWGANFFGQLGDGTTASADLPTEVDTPGGSVITAVAAGGDHSLALTSSGQILAWGANDYGQLGDGTTTSRSTPVAVPAPAGVSFSAIAAGTGHSLALTTTGSVYGWGFNASGQLGNGSVADSSSMLEAVMPAGTTVDGIAAGGSHSLALTSTGAVLAWGSNVFGQLASLLVQSLPVDSPVPVEPLGLPPDTSFVSIAAGQDASYAVTSNGIVWAWGGDFYGQLADGSPGLDAIPPEAITTVPVGTLATGVFTGPDASTAFLVTRAEQSISFPPLPSPTYGDPPVDVAPVIDSGLALDNTAAGACSGPLVRLVLTGAGTCMLTSAQPGSFSYYPASATVNFGVAPAVVTVVPSSATGTAGAPIPPLVAQLAGLRNGDSPSDVSGSASCTTTATSQSSRGAYPITCTPGTLANPNYRFVPGPPGTLTLFASPSGYALVSGDGSIWSLGPAPAGSSLLSTFFGSMSGHRLNAPVVGAAFTPRHDGYWLVASDGGMFSFGAARFEGSMGGKPLNRPIVGMAPTQDGRGYWEVAADGGVFSFGDAPFYGSTGSLRLHRPIVAMAATSDGRGYWLVASDGGVFCFGDASFHGSTGGAFTIDPIVGMAPTPDGRGYWLVSRNGLVLGYGDAGFYGSLRYITLAAPVVGITATSDGQGYWLAGADGGVFSFGKAPFYGTSGVPPEPVDGII